jgi:hypothetical protein
MARVEGRDVMRLENDSPHTLLLGPVNLEHPRSTEVRGLL